MHPTLRMPKTSAGYGVFAAVVVLVFYAVWTPITLIMHGWTDHSYSLLIFPVVLQMFGWGVFVMIVSEVLRFLRSPRKGPQRR